jgi:predicted nucleotidyltransferase
MSTRGFREAYQSALMVRLAEDLEAKVASPAGFALLKLIAWSDRNEHRDAQDLAFVMLNYLDAGNKERLYVDHIDLLDDEFDYILTGVRLLGRDIGSIVEEDIREELLRILSTAGSANGSLNRLAAAIATRGIGFDSKFDNAYQMLSILRRGILDC